MDLRLTGAPRAGGPPRWLAGRWLAGRLVRLAVLLPVAAAAAFLLVSASPIDPVDAYVDAAALTVGPEQRAAIAARLGLDRSAPERLLAWAAMVATGDLGVSSVFSMPVARVIGDRFAASLWLMAGAWIVSGAVGFALGVVAGTWPGTTLDRAIRAYALTLAAAPTFWIAIVLVAVFSVGLGWTPVCCATPPGATLDEVALADRLRHLILPVAALSVLGIAQVTLHTRQKQIEVMASEPVLWAVAHGRSRLSVAFGPALRHAALPALVLHFASLGELFGGSVLAEQVFAYPGLGQATVLAGLRGDVPLLLGITLFAVVFVFVGNAMADLAQRLLDPRVRDAGP